MNLRPASGLLVGAPILLLVLYTLGGLTEQGSIGLPLVPLATLLMLPLDIWIRDLATALTVGALAVGLLAPRPSAAVRSLAVGAGAVWLVALLGQLVLTVSEVFALPWAGVSSSGVGELVGETDLGRVIVAQSVLVIMVVVAVTLGRGRADRSARRVLAWVALILAAVAAWLPGLTGHASMEHGHVAATISLGLHMVFASLWVGGLVAVCVYVGAGGSHPGLMLRRFSVLALVSVIAVAESGLLNASLRLDGVASLITSQYGAVVLAKAAILIVLIAWGWRQRQAIAGEWEVPTSADQSGAALVLPSGFARWCAWEVLWMGAVLGLSVALSRTAPPGVAVAGDHLTSGAVVLLLVAVPVAVLFAFPAMADRLPRARSYPEVWAVAALVAIVVAGAWQASAVAESTVGLQIASVLTVALLLGVGLMVMPCAARSAASALLLMAGLPAAVWWMERDVLGGLSSGTWAAVMLGEGVLAWAAFGSQWRERRRRAREGSQESPPTVTRSEGVSA